MKLAVDEMFAERIGHGYRVMQDQDLYQKCISNGIHFEACPSSSVLTGSVKLDNAALMKHPILQFAHDNANFSINTDDTTVLGSGLDHEYQVLRTWGLNEVHFVRAVRLVFFLLGDEIFYLANGYKFQNLVTLIV